jgi:hypothetical protein
VKPQAANVRKAAAIMAEVAMASADPDAAAARMMTAIATKPARVGSRQRTENRRKNKAARKARKVARG